ncbi:hypothetical protein GCM10023189_19450 [Nibrella saemangeumensis]|uniref:Chromate transporter n=1 Tax=Nibrella saemangeumensis TaxID=1084526 RepID=A0ABP8MRV6_9BACT
MAQQAILEPELAPYFTDKAPFQIPLNFREGFVKYWPIVSLVLLLIGLPAILAFLGLGTLFMPASFMGGVSVGMMYSITMILAIVSFVLSALALPGLFNRKRQGWVFSYYAQMISLVSSVLSISVFGIVFGLLWLLLLFQVRNYYN